MREPIDERANFEAITAGLRPMWIGSNSFGSCTPVGHAFPRHTRWRFTAGPIGRSAHGLDPSRTRRSTSPMSWDWHASDSKPEGRDPAPQCRERRHAGRSQWVRASRQFAELLGRGVSVHTDEPVDLGMDQRKESLLVPGETCWRSASANRYAAVVDGADYLRHVKAGMLNAHHR